MQLPRHIAIIMDGNGRWARQRNLPTIMGHRAGVKSADVITTVCARLGIKALTLYTFSTENWTRPEKEVDALMNLLGKSLNDNIGKMGRNNIRFNVIGRIEGLSPSLQEKIWNAKEVTSANAGMILTLALNYGGRQEIIDAAKALFSRVPASGEDITSFIEKNFEKFLYTNGLPDLDLVIRTSGEMRISNFLLWQAAYAEFYITDALWPDFGEAEFMKALEEYSRRERRFGG
ncbi:MAG: isoprenyl transferase [Candidatus Omnitrophota bacterium]